MTRRRDFLRMADDGGWTVTWTNGNHLKLVHPEANTPVYAASTPSDRRALKNALATMRRALPPEPKPEKPERPKRRKPKPRQRQIDQAIDWQAPPEQPPRRPLPGGPASFVTTRWP